MRRTALLAATAIALAAPAVAEEVNVYSTRQPELIQPLFDAFTAQTGIDVNVVFLKSGFIERLKAEGRRSPADLVMTVDIGNLKAAVDEGVTQPITTPALEAAVPAAFHDPEGLWWGVTARARVAYVSRERVDAEALTYEELSDPKWKGRICTRSGAHQYNLALTAAYIAHHGEEAAQDWLEGLKANLARKPQGNDRAQVKAVWAGQCDLAIGNTYYMAKMLADPEQKEWADSVRIVFPTFEGAGAHMNVSGVAMTTSAPNKDAAIKLMEFLVSPEGQAIYAEANAEYPVVEGVPASDMVASWGTFSPDALPLTEIADKRAAALRLVQTVDFDG
ncbi:Fe(3+) ABC transporter substrate-binding protein [Rhodovulum sp. DZ06]|uniref:Fe(3+) ABC transporter substrate-binding protein n=1 Tax=Rhodovulum sp. DZ06 TaxID=3425126 RepID=UPI003D3311E7